MHSTANIHIHVNIHIHCVITFVCVHLCVHVCVHVCACVYVCMCVRMCVLVLNEKLAKGTCTLFTNTTISIHGNREGNEEVMY